MKKTKKITSKRKLNGCLNSDVIDILNAAKAKSRQEEIDAHGKLISFRTTITRNKKKYDRKQNKREARLSLSSCLCSELWHLDFRYFWHLK